jgi:Tfp pilus assembly protein PilN
MINLYINLLLESEARSASRVSRKFIIRLAIGLVGLSFLLLIIIVSAGAHFAHQQLLSAEQDKKQLKNAFRAVNELRQELAGLQELTNAIASWAQTRPDWPALLSGLQSVVPANIQLVRLTASENIVPVDKVPARVVTLYLQGKAAGEHSETDVQELEKSLGEKPPFKGMIESARVIHFESAQNGAQGNMRNFDIECRFKKLKLFLPSKPKAPDAKGAKDD